MCEAWLPVGDLCVVVIGVDGGVCCAGYVFGGLGDALVLSYRD